MNKKIILTISGFAALLLFSIDALGTYKICGVENDGNTFLYWLISSNLHLDCINFIYGILIVFLPILPFFLFALITYFMREEVYRAWIRFAIPMLGISMLLTALMPDSQGGGFGPQISFGKPDVALLTSAIFVVISIILIARSYLSLRK